MCAPASMILTKDSVLWSKTTDSHEEIIREFGIRDAVGGVPQIVRVEITPPHGNFEAPAKDWTYKLDQDHVPAWYEAEEGERRTREALPAWIAEKIVLRSETIVSLSAGIKLAVYGQVRTVRGNGQVGTVWDNGKVGTVWDNGQVREVWGNGQVGTVRDNGQVREVWDNGQVREVWDNGQVREVWGNGQVGTVGGNGQVGTVRDNGQVREVWGNGQVGTVRGGTIQLFAAVSLASALKAIKGTTAVLIDRSGKTPVCYVGPQKAKQATKRAKKGGVK